MMKLKNKLIFFSSGRSEYSLFEPLLKKLKKKFEIQLIITGSHLSQKYGYTIKQINLNFIKKFFLKINVENNSKNIILKNSSKIIDYIIKNSNLKNTRAVILIGDRYETCSAAFAFKVLGIPIVHIHGGELTFNSLDDIFRYCISKFSELHFVSHESNKNRLIKYGIPKNKVFIVGSLGANIVLKKKFKDRKNIESNYKFKFWDKNFIVTFHPEVNLNNSISKFKNIIRACKSCKDIKFIFTYPNIDNNADYLIKILNQNIKQKNFEIIKSFGTDFYSIMSKCNGIIGNSSSAILEAPSLGIYTLNIGKRQDGRLFSKTVINSDGKSYLDIKKKIIKISNYNKLNNVNLYYKKNTYAKIINKILEKYK